MMEEKRNEKERENAMDRMDGRYGEKIVIFVDEMVEAMKRCINGI